VSVVVVVPSRGRPEQARLTCEAIRDTATKISTRTILAVDADDPTLPKYREFLQKFEGVKHYDVPTLVVLGHWETGNLVKATNTVSMRVAQTQPQSVIGNLGDDHRPRSMGWDAAILEALAEPGIAYGDDLLKGEALPTAPFISAEVVLALSWYALPACRHMFIDDAWKALGTELSRLHYLPDVVIEHVHPGAGKAPMDDGYVRADASTNDDRAAFCHWQRKQLPADAARVRAYLEARVA
jgi:hypothetical protein